MPAAALRLLVVEDDPDDLRLLRAALAPKAAAFPVEVIHAAHIGEAERRAAEMRADIVLLDLGLPGCEGLQALDRLRASAPESPIVVLTGRGDLTLGVEAIQRGAQDYLVKGSADGDLLIRSMRHAIERKRLEDEMERARQQQLEMKDQFLSHIGHELRSPLTAIHQFVTILLDGLAGPLTPQQREYLTIVLRNTGQLRTVLGDLREVARAQTGKLIIEPECVSIAELIHDTIATFETSASARHLVLCPDLAGYLPPLLADPNRVRQVLTNLVGNAIKFTKGNGVIRIGSAASPGEPGFQRVTVSDTGCGIAPEDRERIFERLYQVPDASEASRKGLGLGLYICRQLVDLHGGRMGVDSEVGRGSTFWFTLPLYSLPDLIAPTVMEEGRLATQLSLLAVEASRREPGEIGESVARQIGHLLKSTLIPCQDLLLPRGAFGGQGETFFIVARADRRGAESMSRRILEQLDRTVDLEAAGIVLNTRIHLLPPPPSSAGAAGDVLGSVASQIETLMKESLSAGSG